MGSLPPSWLRMLRLLALLEILAAPFAALADAAPGLRIGDTEIDPAAFRGAVLAYAREQFGASIEADRPRLEGPLADSGQSAYAEFRRWLSVELYRSLSDSERAARAIGTPEDPRIESAVRDWIGTHPHYAEQQASIYFALPRDEVQSSLGELAERTGGRIVAALAALSQDASGKLERFTGLLDDSEARDLAPAALLAESGFTTDWIRRFKDRAAQAGKLDPSLDAVQSLGVVMDAFQAEVPWEGPGGLLELLRDVHDAGEAGHLPIVPLLARVASAYLALADRLQTQLDRLDTLTRRRDGRCLGAGMPTREDGRQQAFVDAFGDALTACPSEVSPDAYVDVADEQRVFFYLDGKFTLGLPEGGGASALAVARRLIGDAGEHEFPRFAGKLEDSRLLSELYDTRYPPPDDPDFAGRKERFGSGLPGLAAEAAALFDSLARRLAAMEALAEREPSCGITPLHAALALRTGLDADRFHHREDPETLRLAYIEGYLERQAQAEESAAEGPPPSRMHDRYGVVAQRFAKLSLLEVHGRVRGAADACAGCTLAIEATGASPLPGCVSARADDEGRYFAFFLVDDAAWSLRLASRGGEARLLNAPLTGLVTQPFEDDFVVDLPPPASEPATPDAGPGSPPDAGPALLAATVGALVEACHFDLARALLERVPSPTERARLTQVLQTRVTDHLAFVEELQSAGAAPGPRTVPWRIRLEELARTAGCALERELAGEALAGQPRDGSPAPSTDTAAE